MYNRITIREMDGESEEKWPPAKDLFRKAGGVSVEARTLQETMEEILLELRQSRLMLEQLEETQQNHTKMLQEHYRLLKEQDEDLLKIKVRLENDLCPKLDMLFEGQVNLAEQRDRDQREMRRRIREVEDKNTILTVQVEELLKA